MRRVIEDWKNKRQEEVFFFKFSRASNLLKLEKKNVWIIKNAKGSGEKSRNFCGNDKFSIEFE